jgi:uncharacterized radical SAM protein YgiQ
MPKFDVIFVLPYLFSDHPSFPEGILKRSLEAEGFSVGVIETPFWQKPESFAVLGKPRLFFAIIPGPVDSVVLNYTSTRKRRREDLYQGNGEAFFPGRPPSIKYKIRPDRTIVVFANRIRQTFKETPIVIGGVEASQRRFAHYDFQEDKIRRSILLDSRADILVTGMGEKQIVEIAKQAKAGAVIKELNIPGSAGIRKDTGELSHYTLLPGMEEIEREPAKLMTAAKQVERAGLSGKGIIQPHEGRFIVEHPPPVYSAKDIDRVYGYDYSRLHPAATSKKMISPALQMNLFSVTSHRGCGGGCAFCSISLHEGKRILSRSLSSILKEIEGFNRHPRWKGIVPDIGGATAELYGGDCHDLKCKRPSCFMKETCHTIAKTGNYLNLLREARRLKGVRQVFLGSGIRYDLLLKNPDLLEEILGFHSGRFMRVAPEHTAKTVLDLMRKPSFEVFEAFVQLFNRIDGKQKRKIELAPYLIIGHPGETLKDVYEMKDRLRRLKLKTTDVQIFTPTPGTLSTAMYYAGVSPKFVEIPVEKNIKELQKRKQILTNNK